jgi:hypothetical protein
VLLQFFVMYLNELNYFLQRHCCGLVFKKCSAWFSANYRISWPTIIETFQGVLKRTLKWQLYTGYGHFLPGHYLVQSWPTCGPRGKYLRLSVPWMVPVIQWFCKYGVLVSSVPHFSMCVCKWVQPSGKSLRIIWPSCGLKVASPDPSTSFDVQWSLHS